MLVGRLEKQVLARWCRHLSHIWLHSVYTL